MRWLALLLAVLLAGAKKPITIDELQEKPTGSIIDSIVWAPSGEKFLYVDSGSMYVYEIKSRQQHKLPDVETTAVKVPPPPTMDWTNRNAATGDPQWFSDNRHVLLAAAGDLFVVDTQAGTFEALTQTAQMEMDPRLAPDNHAVSFVRNHDLYTIDVATKKETRLTIDGSDTLLNGVPDWVYPEELELESAQWWSPDSKSIAYLQFDISKVPVFPLVDTNGLLEPERYPKAGDANPAVRLGIFAGGITRWLDVGDPSNLFARVTWSPDSKRLLVMRLNRIQNQLDLLSADTDGSRVLIHEEDKYWINVKAGPQFVDNERFIWQSERSGFRHLYLYSGELKPLTQGDWVVDDVAGFDNGYVYFTSTQVSPLERQGYSVSLDGAVTRITKEAGTHSLSLGRGHYVDEFSSLSSPPSSTVDGVQLLRKADAEYSDKYEILPTEIVQVGSLYARLIKPAEFRKGKKYPAIVMVYGGPHEQTVRNRWPAAPMSQAFAHAGFVVWQLDNRGSANRGHAFEAPLFRQMGATELADQTTGIEYLVKLGFVDDKRIGMFGWSYGGYMSLQMATRTNLLRAAVAGAPVTDWRNYDSIYTERYMGLPAENPEGYLKSAIKPTLGSTKLLLLHNLEDDNVHVQNTLQVAAALEGAGKRFSMVLYPQKSHGVTGEIRMQMLHTVFDFFVSNLREDKK